MVVSWAAIGSADGAASYYASDNYYTQDELTEHSQWMGEGAKALGLEGRVEADAFAAILNGHLPSGEEIAGKDGKHRAGVDLTFSAPKSVSILALLGGDQRIVEAHRAAVMKTLGWVEKNLAQTRAQEGRRSVPVPTGNLVIALFEHDSSRKLDPDHHIHAAIANLTQRSDGSWRALHNDQIIQKNTLIGSIYHANLRAGIERLGYETDRPGKHGTFEIKGVTSEQITAYSQRRAEILAEAAKLGHRSPKALDIAALATRDAKSDLSAAEVRDLWAARGDDFARLVQATQPKPEPAGFFAQVKAMGEALLERIASYFQPKPDPLLAKLDTSPDTPSLAAGYAVAAAVSHVAEREAAYPKADIIKAALDFAQPGVCVEHVEDRIGNLVAKGALVATPGNDIHTLHTTRDAIRIEQDIVQLAGAGDQDSPALIPETASAEKLLDAAAMARLGGKVLAEEQQGAALAVLNGSSKTVLIQGGSGAGKSTMIGSIADVAKGEGYQLLGLAFQNKMVGDLARDFGIEVQTLHSFIADHHRSGGAGADLARHILVLDEASMVSNRQMHALLSIAQERGVARLVIMGDRGQIPAIEAGRPFALMQDKGVATTIITQNLRQQDPVMRDAVRLAGSGQPRAALDRMGERVRESADPIDAAAKAWLALDDKARAETVLLTSGRTARAALTDQIRAALVKEGKLGPSETQLETRTSLGLTRAEMRHVASYQPGLMVEVHKRDGPLGRGTYRVTASDARTGQVKLWGEGKSLIFRPGQLSAQGSGTSLSERGTLSVREGDRLVWTDKDAKRGMAKNAAVTLDKIEGSRFTLKNAEGKTWHLPINDPMMAKLDHGLALNMHMAQGVTAKDVIAVMNSAARNLSNQTLFYVLSSRAREGFVLHVDNKDRLADRLESNLGQKSAAADVIGHQPDREPSGQVSAPTPEPERLRDKLAPLEVKTSDVAKLLGIEPRAPKAQPAREAPDRSIDKSMERGMDFDMEM